MQILVHRIKEWIYTGTVPGFVYILSPCYNGMHFYTEVYVYICVLTFLVNKKNDRVPR